MDKFVFSPADILIPADADMRKWSVVACDQYSSEPEYWDRVNNFVGDAPSTLRLITPEAYLERLDAGAESARISGVMREYLDGGIFKKYPDAFVYIERAQLDGSIRHGLVGKLDLEQYDYTPGSGKAVAASERTVVSRLPVRIEIRKNALIELPHVMVFFSDPEKTLLPSLGAKKACLQKLYDFDLMENGGNIRGWLVTGENAVEVTRLLASSGGDGAKLVIGDGNHSLAAAKEYWNAVKARLSPEEREAHPARFALVEINNVYDDSIKFEPIHRAVFGIEPQKLTESLKSAFGGGDARVNYVAAGERGEIALPAMHFGDMIAALQDALEKFTAENGGSIDYIHGDDAAEAMGMRRDCAAFLLPCMEKSELFATVAAGRVFPKKSFSVGLSPEKRYYLECRKITD